MNEDSLSHASWNCKYHIAFVPKYRRQIIYRKLEQDIGKILRDLCERKDINTIKVGYCPDHIHILLEIPPRYSISQIMGYLEGKSSLIILDRHASLKHKYGNRHSWCRGYYIDTAGENAKKIQDYIEGQLKKGYTTDQISMKEFIDPFTDEPANKSKK